MSARTPHPDPATPSSGALAGAAAGGASLSLSLRRRLIDWCDRIQNSVVGDIIGMAALALTTWVLLLMAAAVSP